MGREWPVVSLSEVAKEITVGFVGSMTKEYVASGVPFLRSKNISAHNIKWDDIKYISSDFHAKLKKSGLQPGDVAIVRTGKPGTTCVIPSTLKEANCSDLVIVRTDGKQLNPHFLSYFMNSAAAGQQINSHVVGAVQQHFNVGSAKKIRMSLPSIEEQDGILRVLMSIDAKINLNRQTNQTLEQMAQALFKSWFVDFDPVIDNALAAGNPIPDELQQRAERRQQQLAKPDHKPLPDDILQLFPSEFELTEELGWVPKGWLVSNVGSCFNVTMGQSPPGSTYNSIGTGLPFFQGKTDFGFRFPSNRIYCTAPKRLANEGDTLVSVRAPVGDINIAYEDCCIGRGVAAVRHNSNSESFTYYAMNQLSEHFKVFEGEGTVFGSINQKDFNALPQLNVDDKITSAFHRLINPCDKKILICTNQIYKLTKLRDTLLPKLISGELRLPSGTLADVEQQPANAIV